MNQESIVGSAVGQIESQAPSQRMGVDQAGRSIQMLIPLYCKVVTVGECPLVPTYKALTSARRVIADKSDRRIGYGLAEHADQRVSLSSDGAAGGLRHLHGGIGARADHEELIRIRMAEVVDR